MIQKRTTISLNKKMIPFFTVFYLRWGATLDSSMRELSKHIRRYLIPLLIPIIALILSVAYFSCFEFRNGYVDLDDAVIEFAIAVIIFFMTIILQRSVEKSSARLLMQMGWMIVFIGVYHTGLIQVVDLSCPIGETAFSIAIVGIQASLPLIFGFGAVLVMAGVHSWIVDVSARERMFHSIVEAMPVGVAVMDLSGRVVLHNEGLAYILNLEDSRIGNVCLKDLLSTHISFPKEDTGQGLEQVITSDILYKGGHDDLKTLTLSVVADRDKDGRITGYIAVISDITSRVRNEEEREQQRRVIELYTSLLSHDIGNDLQSVLGYIEGAQTLVLDNPDTALAMLSSASAAGARMANLIRTFNIDTIPSHVQVASMLKEVALRAERASIGFKVEVECSPDAMNIRSPGGSLLPIAIENLLRNAVQHAGDNPMVFVNLTRSSDKAIIRVADTGPGIPQDRRESLFHRSGPGKENGLGLYLTKQIVVACGGTIELEDSSSGAAFTIELPIIE